MDIRQNDGINEIAYGLGGGATRDKNMSEQLHKLKSELQIMTSKFEA